MPKPFFIIAAASMSLFLGIYNKSGFTVNASVQKAVEDFSLHGKRPLVQHDMGRFSLYFPKYSEQSFFENTEGFAYVAGYFTSEKLKKSANQPSAISFHEAISKHIDSANFHGAFAAIHFDKKTNRVTVVNDKYGVFPLFRYENHSIIAFCSEYQPLCALIADTKPAFDRDAIAQYFCLGTTLGDKTFIRNIYNVAPGSHITVEDKSLVTKSYPVKKAGQTISAAEVFDIFSTVNKEYIDSGLTSLVLLSAGADSRLILATMTEEQRKNAAFYTSNLSFLNTEEDMDVIGAGMLAKTFGLNHTVEKISFYENTFSPAYFTKAREPRNNQVYGGWHGGEFLGGYSLNAAPAGTDLSFESVDKKLRSFFSWRFRIRLKKHPYQAYLDEKKDAGPDHVFFIRQLTRSFFSSIYGGSRGHWLQPFNLTHHGMSPFWDSRFLDALTCVPIEKLKNYAFYNEVLALCHDSFLKIPSNSPLTNRSDSVIEKLRAGTEPKHRLPDVHGKTLTLLMTTGAFRKGNMFSTKMEPELNSGQSSFTKQWLDFEVWKQYVSSLF